jgi:large subunit ribosomal protein L25
MTTQIISLEIKERDFSVNPRMLRREGRLPATIYGRNVDSISVDLDKKSFTYIYLNQNPHLVTLVKGSEKFSALLKNVQVDPRTFEILNVEFLQVKADQKVNLSIPLLLENESPAVKLGGVLYQMMTEIAIECLPGNIPDKICYDISVLDQMDITVTINDLAYPEGVVPVLSLDSPVFKISSPKAETEKATDGAAPAAAAAAPAS